MQKTGWKTTEFWITLATVVGATAEAISRTEGVPSAYLAVAAAIAGGAYAISRGLAKMTLPPP